MVKKLVRKDKSFFVRHRCTIYIYICLITGASCTGNKCRIPPTTTPKPTLVVTDSPDGRTYPTRPEVPDALNPCEGDIDAITVIRKEVFVFKQHVSNTIKLYTSLVVLT